MKTLKTCLLCASTLLIFGRVEAQQRNGQTQNGRPPAFQRMFVIRGVEFNETQQTEVEKLRQKYLPELTKVQRLYGSVYTNEQRRALREVTEAGRKVGKTTQKIQAEIDQAVMLSVDQQNQRAAARKKQAELIAEIQKALRKLLTDEQRKQLSSRERTSPAPQTGTAPDFPDLQYGPHERHVMDVWLAKSDEPTPVLVSIHGGGFRAGRKSVDRRLLQQCLEAGISVVAITYRFSQDAIAPAQHHDAARAIQFIRQHAKKWNVDPDRFAATGGSAGAGLSLWLGFHDDLADPDSQDPILRHSTRLSCMTVYNGQSSYDPRFIRDLFPETDTYKHSALAQLFDVDLSKLDELPQEKYDLFAEISALPHFTKDDVPTQLHYAAKMETPISNQGVGIHHPKFGYALKTRMDKLGIECEVITQSQRGSEQWVTQTMKFLKKHLHVQQ